MPIPSGSYWRLLEFVNRVKRTKDDLISAFASTSTFASSLYCVNGDTNAHAKNVKLDANVDGDVNTVVNCKQGLNTTPMTVPLSHTIPLRR